MVVLEHLDRQSNSLFRPWINQLFLCHQPGYTPPGSAPAKPVLTLPELNTRLRAFLVETYHQQPHSETGAPPHTRWEADGFIPRLPRLKHIIAPPTSAAVNSALRSRSAKP